MCYSRRRSISWRFNDRTQHKFHPVTENLLHTAGFTTAPPLNLCYLHIPACVQRALAGNDDRAGYPRYPTDCISSERFYLPVGVLICLFKKLPYAVQQRVASYYLQHFCSFCATLGLNSSLSNVTVLTLVRCRLRITAKNTMPMTKLDFYP